MIIKRLDSVMHIRRYSVNRDYCYGTYIAYEWAARKVAKTKPAAAYLAVFAEVEVDIEMGKVEVLKIAALVDCGTAINPNVEKIQLEGALVQGIGMALFEEANDFDLEAPAQ